MKSNKLTRYILKYNQKTPNKKQKIAAISNFLAVNYLEKKRNHNPQFAIKKAKKPTYELNGCENSFNLTWY